MSEYSGSLSPKTLMLKRVKQIIWLVILALSGNLAILIHTEAYLHFFLVTLIIATLLYGARLAHQQRYESAANILITTLSVGILALIWDSGGLYDLSILGIPGLLIVSAMLGMYQAYRSLLAIVLVNLLLIGFVEEYGYMTFEVTTSGLARSVAISLILIPIVSASWMLAKDYRTALGNLEKSLKATKASAEEVEFLASHDMLTQLPNRAVVSERFEHAKSMAARTPDKPRIGLIYIDLDGFKDINDTLGHHVGDSYLKFIAKRFAAAVRDYDTVARLGGDEFLLLIEQVSEIDELVAVAEHLLEASHLPFEYQEQSIKASASMGIAVYPDDGVEYDELVSKADLAMYHSKALGRSTFSFFDSSMSKAALIRAEMLEDLKQALLNDEFYLVYQPIINLKSGVSEGAEALIRWCHPVKGEISPASFIPLAEQSGLISDIGAWVIDKAAEDCAYFQRELGIPYLVSVNVSAVQLQRGSLTDILQTALNRHQLVQGSLYIELTESELLAESEAFEAFLRFTAKHHIKLAIDDFGTGYSNLGYLHRIDISRIKLDYSFIHQICQSKEKCSIVSSIQHLASSLGVETVAEGVETQEELEQIRALGVNRAQGYYWAKPLVFDEMLSYLSEQQEKQAS